MALSPLNWRLLQPRSLPLNYTIHDFLDAVFTMGNDLTYADGSPRVPGTGSAWTWTRDQTVNPGLTTAAIGVPPINALNMTYIIAGDSTARTPTMNTDSWRTAQPLIGMIKNSGVYNAWNVAAPMTTGQFSGFIRATSGILAGAGNLTPALSPATMFLFECQEAIWGSITRNSDGQSCLFGAGALIDPLSGAALNAESDGRLYSILGGQGTPVPTTWLSSALGSVFNSSAGADAVHWFTFDVGAVNTTRNTRKVGDFTGLGGNLLAPGGEVPNVPFSAYFPTTGQYAGQYRQIGLTRSGVGGTENAQNGVKKGYSISNSTQAVGTCVLLGY